MSRCSYAVPSKAKQNILRWFARVTPCISVLLFLSLLQSASAQIQQSRQQSAPVNLAELAECQQFIPIAKELIERIVDHINSPRPEFTCRDFGRVAWEGSKIYSIIRVAHLKFCEQKYCYTAIYNEQTKNIMFSMDAENIVDRFEHARDHVISLKPIVNHGFENTTNGLLLTTRNGVVAISAFNEVLTISIAPQKGAQ